MSPTRSCPETISLRPSSLESIKFLISKIRQLYTNFRLRKQGTRCVSILQVCSFCLQGSPTSTQIRCLGTTIALTTTEAENRSILRLFDVGNKDKRPTSTITVDPYPSSKARGFEKYEGEVTSTAFSPDEVFLALGRNDNTVHVYDTRYLHKGPLYRLEHEGECKSAGKEKYGIAKVEWLHSEQTRRIALATAGEDGTSTVM